MVSGFDSTDLPVGSGLDAGSRKGNEGEAEVTLSGSSDAVDSIVVAKYYRTDDALAVLKQQLPGSMVQGIAHCLSEDADDMPDDFYSIEIADAITYAEVAVIAGTKGGPEQTIFTFQRDHPDGRISELKCTK